MRETLGAYSAPVIKPTSPKQFADSVLAIVAKALESDASLETMTTDVNAVLKGYTDRVPSKIIKLDAARRMAYGFASVVTKDGEPVNDQQGDEMDMDNVRKVVHEYIREERVGKAMHDGPQIGEILDSFVMDAEVQKALGVDFGCEGWLVGFHVTDDATWARVESGELAAFSIGGLGDRTPITE